MGRFPCYANAKRGIQEIICEDGPMEQGLISRFFRPTRAKIISTLVLTLVVVPLDAAAFFYCLFTSSTKVSAVCDGTIGRIVGYLYYNIFMFPSFILSQCNYQLYYDIPLFIIYLLDIVFTLALFYLLSCVLSIFFEKRKQSGHF